MAARRRIAVFATTAAVALAIGAPAAHAGAVDVWTTYSGMSACKSGLNNYCFGLQDSQAIGLIDSNLTVDELDQSAGIFYNDDNILPAPEGAANPVVEVWNNTSDYTFIAPGTDPYEDAVNGIAIYNIPPYSDLTGPAMDAVDVEAFHQFREQVDIELSRAESEVTRIEVGTSQYGS